MTTLPQMTSLRLPRAGTPHLAIPVGGGMAAAGAPAAFRMSGADIWRVIRANLWLIIIMVAAMGTLGWFANQYLANKYPRYTAVGLVQVQTAISFNPLLPNATQYNSIDLPIELKTQTQLLKQDSLISEVLRKSDKIRETEWFRETGGNVELARKDLHDNFTVNSVPDTKLIAISMTYKIPKDTRTIVDEIVNEHLAQQRKLSQDKQLARSQILNNMRDTVGTRLKDIARELRETSIKLNIDGMGAPGRMSAKEIELADLVRRQLEVQQMAAQAKAQLDATNAMVQRGETPAKVEEFINRDQKIFTYTQRIDDLDMAIAAAQGSQGGESPRAAMFKKQRDLYQQKLEDAKAELKNNLTITLLGGLRDEAAQTQAALESISKRVDAVKEDLGALNNLMSAFMARKDEEKQLLKTEAEVDQQLEQIVQTQNQQDMSTVSWMTRPDIPGTMSFPKLGLTMTVAIFLGLVLSLGIAFLREAMDTTVRSPRDVARVGQLNLLGMVPDEQDDPQASGGRLPLVIFDSPNSMLSEQLRQVRTRLQMAASLDTTRTLMVTSPSPGDGKSTIAANLAAGLALNGRKILLVDANFRRPDLHKIFGIGNEVGFSDALASGDRFNEACHETQVPNLSVMATGAKPANPTELLESQLLVDFIEQALKEFDHVIFDSGPLLFVSDSVALAPRVDGVITVVRARSNSRGLLTRMRDTLKQIKAEHVGVVLNAVRAQGGGYYGRNIKTYYAYQNGN
jgi:succinoglycan biosynthesis transport protein ExoP